MEKLPFSYMNAAGWAKKTEQVRLLAEIPYLSHIVIGSFTVEPREGNIGGTNFAVAEDGTSVNSLGLPNGGIPYLKKHGEEMVHIVHDAGKILVISIAGFSPAEYGTLAATAFSYGADVVEINAGCPNVHDGGHQKEIISYDFDLLRETLSRVEAVCEGHSVWLKVSPYANPADRERLARLVKGWGRNITALVATNTFPNVSLYNENGKPLVDVADNYAGMAGTALRPISLSQCRHYHSLLPELNIIGVGGIQNGYHIEQYIRRGCRGVQVATEFFKNEDARVFQHMAEDWATRYAV